jgi:hypothetical protein
MRSEAEIRAELDKALALRKEYDDVTEDANALWFDDVYNVLSWVLDEGDDPLEGYEVG